MYLNQILVHFNSHDGVIKMFNAAMFIFLMAAFAFTSSFYIFYTTFDICGPLEVFKREGEENRRGEMEAEIHFSISSWRCSL